MKENLILAFIPWWIFWIQMILFHKSHHDPKSFSHQRLSLHIMKVRFFLIFQSLGVDILPKNVKQCPHTYRNSALIFFKYLITRRIIVIGSTFAYFALVFLYGEMFNFSIFWKCSGQFLSNFSVDTWNSAPFYQNQKTMPSQNTYVLFW